MNTKNIKFNQKLRSALIFVIMIFSFNVCAQKKDSIIENIGKKINYELTGYSAVHPKDIPKDIGLFIYSKDGRRMIRFFGSFRFLMNVDNRKQFLPYHIDPPQIPTGEKYFTDWNSNWTINNSVIGLDALYGEKRSVLVRFELDWKGTNSAFRIRHLFFRTQHWLIGKSWTSFNSLEFLPFTVDSHLMGGGSGARVPQIRYYDKVNKWKFQIGAEYLQTKLVKPENIDAEPRILLPSIAAKTSYDVPWGKTSAAAVVKFNRAQYLGANKRSQTVIGYGINLNALVRVGVDNFAISGYAGRGMSTYVVDYAFINTELVYNPDKEKFNGTTSLGGYMNYKRQWDANLFSTLAFGFNTLPKNKYMEELTFHYSYKAIINLFYRPTNKELEGFSAGAEFLYAARHNKNNSINNAVRPALIVMYDF